MTVMFRQLKAFIFEAPPRQKKSEASSNSKRPSEPKRKPLSVTISKEPPAIVYFERDVFEESFECIFDPQVHHDDEKDHPDLFADEERKKDSLLKPWQKPPYCSNNKSQTFMSRFKSAFINKNSNFHINNPFFMHQSNHSSDHVAA